MLLNDHKKSFWEIWALSLEGCKDICSFILKDQHNTLQILYNTEAKIVVYQLKILFYHDLDPTQLYFVNVSQLWVREKLQSNISNKS